MKLSPIDPERARQYFEDKLRFTTGPAELAELMKDGSVRVVDVRAKEDFARERIPGSTHLPESEWSRAADHGLTKDKPNVLSCYSHTCHLAARAAIELARQGFAVMELDGGFAAWKEEKLPVESGEAGAHEAVERARAFLAEARSAQAAEQPKPEAPDAERSESEDVKASDQALESAPSHDGAKADGEEEAKPEGPDADRSESEDVKASDQALESAPSDDGAKADGEEEAKPEAPDADRSESEDVKALGRALEEDPGASTTPSEAAKADNAPSDEAKAKGGEEPSYDEAPEPDESADERTGGMSKADSAPGIPTTPPDKNTGGHGHRSRPPKRGGRSGAPA